MYYAVQSLFYFMAGPTIRSAQILSAIMAALLAMLLFLRLRPEAGPGHRCIGGSESSGRTCGERNTCLGLLRYPDPLLYTEPLLVHRESSTFSGQVLPKD
jgi:Na+-transporting NADH:ubiquinone oxidoreductase subunit NqrA